MPLIRHVAETVSTNADMLERARAGETEGSWLYADTQTGGRGRQGRLWISPPGNLYASGLVQLREGDPAAASLALVAGIAVWDALCSIAPGAALQLKWPNDVLAGNTKLAGILLERERSAVVIGVGVNIVHQPEGLDRPVTSLSALKVKTPSPLQMVEELSAQFAHWLNIWRGQGLSAIIDAWQIRAHQIDTPLSVDSGNGERLEGAFAGLDEAGALILRLADGSNSVIQAGDVFLI